MRIEPVIFPPFGRLEALELPAASFPIRKSCTSYERNDTNLDLSFLTHGAVSLSI